MNARWQPWVKAVSMAIAVAFAIYLIMHIQ